MTIPILEKSRHQKRWGCFFFWKKNALSKAWNTWSQSVGGFPPEGKFGGQSFFPDVIGIGKMFCFFFLKLGAFYQKDPKKRRMYGKGGRIPRWYHITFFFLWFCLNKFYGSFLMRADIFVEIRSLAHFGSPDLPFYHHKKWLPVKQDTLSNQPRYIVICIYYIYTLYTYIHIYQL